MNNDPVNYHPSPRSESLALRRLTVAFLCLLVSAAASSGCSAERTGGADSPPIAPLPSDQTSLPSGSFSETETTRLPTGPSAPTPPGKEGYELIFADEFDEGSVDHGTWEKLTPWGTRLTNNELQFYDPENTEVDDGKLRIKVEKRRIKGKDYASGVLTSLNRKRFKYGYYEMRAKAPKGQGIWPAFWLTDDDTSEIDIFELLGQEPRRLHATMHHTHSDGRHQHRSEAVGADYSADYHIFAVDWEPDRVIWFVDGVEYWRYEGDDVPDASMWLVLNVAVGGEWPGAPDETTEFPQEYLVDYVRVYQRR